MDVNTLHIGKVDVSQLHCELLSNPWLWNLNTKRTAAPGSPHRQVDDIWVRYNENPPTDPEEPVDITWLGASLWLPAARSLSMKVFNMVGGTRLGGVLITRIPAGKDVDTHADKGWHPRTFQKYAVQVAAEPESAFCHSGSMHISAPGDVYWFNNLVNHWVVNPSTKDRITMIVCASGV